MAEDIFAVARHLMVEEQLVERGITDPEVLSVMREIPRHEFVSIDKQEQAYNDCALPVGPGQSISQPFIVARMLQALQLSEDDKVLEIGTGTGYQTAILSHLVGEVYSVEIDLDLLKDASQRLEKLECSNVLLKNTDGFGGWREYAPYDVIIVTASPVQIPRELMKQLDSQGRMILPLGGPATDQELVLLEKGPDGLKSTELGSVRFVSMVRGGEI